MWPTAARMGLGISKSYDYYAFLGWPATAVSKIWRRPWTEKVSLVLYFFQKSIQIFQVGPTHRLKRDAELEKPVAMTGNDPPQYIVEHDGNYLFVVHIEGKQFFESQGFYMKYYTAL